MLRRLILIALVAMLVAAGAVAAWIGWEAAQLPSAERLRASVYERRTPGVRQVWMPLWAFSDRLQTAVVTWEDPAFFHHGAINPPEIVRAAWLNLKARRYERGASTITQQVVKNQFLSPEKTVRRKLREMILAHRLERVLKKDQILTVYLNVAYWGDGVAGAEAASRHYFGLPASRLDWAQAALLAGMLPNPRERNPCTHPSAARKARAAVLAKLLEYGRLSDVEMQQAQAMQLPRCPERWARGSRLPSSCGRASNGAHDPRVGPRTQRCMRSNDQ